MKIAEDVRATSVHSVHDEVAGCHTGHSGQRRVPTKCIQVKTGVGVDDTGEPPGGLRVRDHVVRLGGVMAF
jgi:hypothetical protein